MKIKRNIILAFIFLNACTNKEFITPTFNSQVITGGVNISTKSTSSITSTSVISGGYVINDVMNSVKERGICYSTLTNPTINNQRIICSNTLSSFETKIIDLIPNTNYFLRAYAIIDSNTFYGNQENFTTSEFSIGLFYNGGIIFYIDKTHKHGLIASTNDQSNGIEWYNGSNINTNAIGTVVGSGQINTKAIIKAQGVGNYAASLCDDLVIGNNTDWFLPSALELNLLYEKRNLISNLLGDIYWSSSEYSSDAAWAQPFFSFSSSAYLKKSKRSVRAICSF